VFLTSAIGGIKEVVVAGDIFPPLLLQRNELPVLAKWSRYGMTSPSDDRITVAHDTGKKGRLEIPCNQTGFNEANLFAQIQKR